jgi:lipid-A-disaccharide synthase
MSSISKEVIRPLFKVAIVAGEKSGDQLGGELIKSLKLDYPDCKFIGIGGDLMKGQGLQSLYDIERLAVMGIWEPFKRLPELLKLRSRLKSFLLNEKPDIFIGIDSPDFNLPLANFLKKETSIPTVQYVSPSVWAWRKGRIKKIERSIDLMLCLFPFEGKAYEGSKVNHKYVGHPLAHRLLMKQNSHQKESQKDLTIGLLPGSRKSEIIRMAPTMIAAAKDLQSIFKGVKFVMPLVKQEHLSLFEYSEDEIRNISFSFSNSQVVLKECDYALVTSGTATLEALLLGVPLLSVYKTNWISFNLIKPFLRIKYIALPNLLADEEIIPELLQDHVTVSNIVNGLSDLIKSDKKVLLGRFQDIHNSLLAGGKEAAKDEILEFYSKCT